MSDDEVRWGPGNERRAIEEPESGSERDGDEDDPNDTDDTESVEDESQLDLFAFEPEAMVERDPWDFSVDHD